MKRTWVLLRGFCFGRRNRNWVIQYAIYLPENKDYGEADSFSQKWKNKVFLRDVYNIVNINEKITQ